MFGSNKIGYEIIAKRLSKSIFEREDIVRLLHVVCYLFKLKQRAKLKERRRRTKIKNKIIKKSAPNIVFK